MRGRAATLPGQAASPSKRHFEKELVMAKTEKKTERDVVATLHREQANALVAYLNYKK